MPSEAQPFIINHKDRTFVHDRFPKYLAEFVGTFFLVFTVGCNVHTGSIGAAVSIGAILMVMVYALGPVSGGHLNPAVTLAVGLSGRGKISFEDMCCYILAQIVGGVVGAFHYWIIFNDAFLLQPVAGYSQRDVAWAEILYTMALCYVVLNVATTENKEQGNVPNDFFGLAIGLTVTSAAIAIGPISGCSLNPAVSIGAFFASKLAHGIAPASHVALYCLAPLFGACLATLFFYFVQGGLTGQYEYEMGPSRPASPVVSRPVSRPLSPVPRLLQPNPRHTAFLKSGEVFPIDQEVEGHSIFLGMSWTVDKQFASADVDASCVKFTSEGRLIDAVYFAKPQGNSGSSIVQHAGDNLTGKGVGFGFLEESPKKHGQGKQIKDDEKIQINNLSKLRMREKSCTYMFIVINVFSGGQKFDHMQEMSIRIVDQETGKELCRFEKKDMQSQHTNVNGFLLGVLFWHRDHKRWYFQVIDEAFDVKEHGTYREFEPKLKAIVRKMEGLDAVTTPGMYR